MKHLFKHVSIAATAIIFTALFPAVVLAQDPGPDPDVPIDGGVSMLVAAGVAFGVKSVNRKKHHR